MKKFLKGLGLLGGSAAACVACCTVPIFMGPLLTWIGVTSLGLVFSPWYLLLLAVPALVIFMRKLYSQTARTNVLPLMTAAAVRRRQAPKGVIMASNKPAPIACTLSAMEFKDRAASIAQLTSTSLLAHQVDGCTAHLLYRQDAKKTVEQLVRQEQACCGFLSFEMGQSSDGITLTITAPQEAQGDAEALFAHLLPSQETPISPAIAPETRSCGCASRC